MPSPKISPKDEGGPRFLKKILGAEKKKRKVIRESDDEDDGIKGNPTEDSAAVRSKKLKSEIPRKSKAAPRSDDEPLVPSVQVPKKESAPKHKTKTKGEDGAKKKATSSLLTNMEAPPPAAPPAVVGKGPFHKPTKPEGKDPVQQPDPIDLTVPTNRLTRSNSNVKDPYPPKSLEPFPTVASPAKPPSAFSNNNMAGAANQVVSTIPADQPFKKKMTPKGRVMMSTLEKLCDKLNDHTQFQMLLRTNLPTTTTANTIDLAGSFSQDETQAYDFFHHNANGDILVPPKIAIFPEEFPPGFHGHSLHWWGIVDPAVGARTKNSYTDSVHAKPTTTTTAKNATPEAAVVATLALSNSVDEGVDAKASNSNRATGGGGGEVWDKNNTHTNRRSDPQRRDDRRRSSPGRGGGYHGQSGPPPPGGWSGGGGGGRWEEDYGRWEGGGGRYPPPPHWDGGGPEGRRVDHRGGGGGGDPHHRHHHRGGPPPNANRGRGPPSMDRPPMGRSTMDRPPPADRPPNDRPISDRPPMDRERNRGPPPNFQSTGGRGPGAGR